MPSNTIENELCVMRTREHFHAQALGTPEYRRALDDLLDAKAARRKAREARTPEQLRASIEDGLKAAAALR